MSEWRDATIAGVARPKGLVGGPFGSNLVSRDYTESGVPVIRGQNLSSGRWVDFGNCVYVSGDKAARDLRGNIAEPGDLVYTQRGTLGQVAILPSDSESSIISQSQMRLRVDTSKADPLFVYYASTAPDFVRAVADHAIVAGVPHINLGILGTLPIRLPSLSVQREIVAVLDSIDSLIENSRQRVGVLEDMARAIYREWFVHFRYPGHESVPLVESPLGPVPKGWRTGVLDDLVRVVKDTVGPSSLDPDIPAVGLEHIPRQQITLDGWGVAGDQGSRKGVFARGDVLFGKIRPYFHKVSVAPFDGICSTDAIVLRPEEPHWGQAVFVLSSVELVAHATTTSNGTKMPRADWKVLGKWPVVIPPDDVAGAFTGIARNQLALAETLMFENTRLAALRDLLLPKLVTGQIDVSGIDLDTLLGESAA